MDILALKSWSPYWAGAGIGILSWFTFLLSDKPIGCSTAFLTGRSVDHQSYYQKFPAKIDWEWMFVIGIIIGSFCSASLSGEFQLRWLPSIWIARFGLQVFPRILTAFLGGILMGIGARWANGCTSGHGISGTLQLVVSSWIAVIFFFVGGILAAYLIY